MSLFLFSDSSGEEHGLVAYEEAPDSIYDSFIRRSTAPHDDDEASHISDRGDNPVPVLPSKNDRGASKFATILLM